MTYPDNNSDAGQLIANLTEQSLIVLLSRLSKGDHYDVEFGQTKGEVSVIQLHHAIESLRKLRKDLQVVTPMLPGSKQTSTVSIGQIRTQVGTDD